MLYQYLALTVAALFTGAAVYINIAEQPARLGLDDRALLQEWKPSYKRGFAMQASLAVIGFLLGMKAYWDSNEQLFAIGAVFMILNWPYTLLVIMPVNHKLDATPFDGAGPETRRLIEKWGWLHAGRSLLGLLGTLSFLWALS